MAARSLTERVEILEQKVGNLQELPARMAAVESQILQLRGEVRDGFSANQERFASIDQRLDDLKNHMRVLHEDVVGRISVTKEAPIQDGRRRRKR